MSSLGGSGRRKVANFQNFPAAAHVPRYLKVQIFDTECTMEA
jgi:hypothetical protein